MSTTLLSAFYDINDFLCNKNEKSLNNYNNFNSMLDKKAVGTPVTSFAPGFLRRHSTSNLQALTNSSSSKYPSSSFPNIKESNNTAMLNKENKFRDRSFSESAERLHQQQHPPLSPLHLVQQQQQQKQPGGGGGQVNSTRYKTELCRPFEESGTCKYGDKCQFAHGMHELRSLTRHPKYKTELCRTFHTIGFCPYGPRCHFIHNAEERRQAPTNNNAVNSFHQQHHSRPKLHHSLSFSGFPSASSGLESPLLESPTSRTPPPPCSSSSAAASSFVFCDELLSPTLPACANNAFTFSSQELSSLLTPLAIQTQQLPGGTGGYGQQQSANGCPPSPPFLLSHVQSCLRRLADSPVFDAPPSPPDSLSDRESYLSGSLSSGSLSGSESPSMDPGRRLPIFSRLSISED